MEPFSYCNPTRLVYGASQVARIDELVPADARVLVTYGGGSAERNGSLPDVRKALGARHVVEFGGIGANPEYEHLVQALPIIERERISYVIAVGGGSVIDGTKFIVAAAAYEGADKYALMRDKREYTWEETLPLGAVLTLSATGSEMNSGAVISYRAKGLKLGKHLVYPRFAIVDAGYSATLPWRQLANGVVDAFVHVCEQYLTVPGVGRLQDRFAESILQTLVEIGPRLKEDSSDRGLREDLAFSATLALNGLIACGVPEDWATHMVGHELTAACGLDHAVSLAVVLPPLLRHEIEGKRGKLAQCGRRVFGITSVDDDRAARECIVRIEHFLRDMTGPNRLGELGCRWEDAEKAVEAFSRRGWALGERGSIDAQAVREILEDAK